MQRLTRSSQPGFMDARRRLVSKEVILPILQQQDTLDLCVGRQLFITRSAIMFTIQNYHLKKNCKNKTKKFC